MNILIIILIITVIVRTVSYAVSCCREKNILGGVSVFFLVLASVFSVYYLVQI